ncbi:hypothetical protein GALMADRAFT_215745 [Galerina marginata CBS 339.88]|uniref:DUF7918 domain-containing protein n=1 Tax=Galerina marginata (strain CBS 339.88) TaxID=685588 RepID=A0A067SCI1_GALM3|nr:hypothetical protein GALMADRAFT_215745 [Galerina marginata CBS 339.88]
MPPIGCFSSWVQVDGEVLPEYQVEYSPDGTQATCWIPSELGKEFQIGYQDSVGALTTASKVFVDGTFCNATITYSRHSPRYKTSVIIHKGAPISATAIRPFVFAPCQLLDDDNLLMNSPAVGEIKVVVEEIEVRESSNISVDARNLPPLHIHERAKKGIVHDVLIADGIVPPPNPPPRKPLAATEDVIDLTLDDDDDEEHRQPSRQNRNNVKAEIKQERSVVFDDSVIDLT